MNKLIFKILMLLNKFIQMINKLNKANKNLIDILLQNKYNKM